MVLVVREIDRLDGHVRDDDGFLAPSIRPSTATTILGRLRGLSIDLVSLGRRATRDRRIEDVDLADPSLDPILAEKGVEEKECAT